MKYLLDTNTCIALMRRNARVRERMERLVPGDCAVSAITAFELYHGLERCSFHFAFKVRLTAERSPTVAVDFSPRSMHQEMPVA